MVKAEPTITIKNLNETFRETLPQKQQVSDVTITSTAESTNNYGTVTTSHKTNSP